MAEKKKYDSTIARMAGNIASGLVSRGYPEDWVIAQAVALARRIVAEVERTEPVLASRAPEE